MDDSCFTATETLHEDFVRWTFCGPAVARFR